MGKADRTDMYGRFDLKESLNPLTLRAAKRGLTILGIFYSKKHFLENI